MSGNKYIETANPHRLLTPGSVLLITAGDGKDDNIFSVAWNMPLRKKPPMVAILSGKGHYTYGLIKKTGEFGINIPDIGLAESVIYCGKNSGRDVRDKFKEAGLSRVEAEEISAPMVAEAAARIECRISQVVDMGYSSLLIADILRAQVLEDAYTNGKWDFAGRLELIHHIGGAEFAVSGRSIETSE
ncbi:MAG TPA: flavin reductase family protein [Candidatus Krumholzibacteriaceae bacterium]|nr:flavin reductase family protein [Candidatus Krumholzibacteriaceae bacterium]